MIITWSILIIVVGTREKYVHCNKKKVFSTFNDEIHYKR
jgi:hypothetical protein